MDQKSPDSSILLFCVDETWRGPLLMNPGENGVVHTDLEAAWRFANTSQMSLGKLLPLSTGTKLPQIGLGTGMLKSKECEDVIEFAIRHGYRHLDLALIYLNQVEVGAALKRVIPSVVKREDLFITSKLSNMSHQPARVEKELDETLRQLDLDYLDLYLVHWPIAFLPHSPMWGEPALDEETSLVDAWKAMIALPKSKVKAIGVSNYTIEHLQGIIAATGIPPAVNQIEAHPLLPQDDLVDYCNSQNIRITAYSPLGNNYVGKPKLTDHKVVIEVAEKLGATPAQVLIAWGAHRGYSIIPLSVQEERILSNFKQIELSQEDCEKVSSIGIGNRVRYCIPITFWNVMSSFWNVNVFDEPVEKDAEFKVKIQ